MNGSRLLVLGAVLCGAGATPALSADVPLSIQNAARCAPRATSAAPGPIDALRVIGAQDSAPRTLFGTRDLLIIGAGTGRGVALGQQFVIRRAPSPGGWHIAGPRAIGTTGWLRIVAVNETTSIGIVEFACDGIQRGDYLEPYFELILPANLDRPDTTGELDFSAPARVLFGNEERATGATGDFMVIDAGLSHRVEPGARFAIYRDLNVAGMPLAPVGEAIVVHAGTDTAVVRLTMTRDAVQQGDLLIPRKRPTQ
jgi:hypothetical protein